MRSFGTSLVLLAGFLVVSSPGALNASLLGTNVTVILFDPTVVDVDDDDVTVIGGPEIEAGDGSDIGDNFLLPNEFIDIQSETLVYQAVGVGDDHPDDSNYQLVGGIGADTFLIFADLDWGAMLGEIIDVNVILEDAIGVTDADIVFNGHQVEIPLNNLGLLKGTGPNGESLGTITIELITTHPAAIPEASSVAIWLVGGAVGLMAYRRKRTSATAG